MSDRADEVAQEFVPENATKIMVDTRSGDRHVYSADEWREHIATALRASAEEAIQEERDVAAKDVQMRYEDGYACGRKDEREACAAIIEATMKQFKDRWSLDSCYLTQAAAAIRAQEEGKR